MNILKKSAIAILSVGALALAFWLLPQVTPGAGDSASPALASATKSSSAMPVDHLGAATPDRKTGTQAAAPSTVSNPADLLARIPAGPFRSAIALLSEPARQRALRELGDLAAPQEDFASLRVAPDGGLYYVCSLPSGLPVLAAGGRPASNATTSFTGQAVDSTVSTTSVPISAPPVRHSRPGSTKILYLDFNGHTITGTRWNSTYGVSTYSALPFDTDGDPTTFGTAEQAAIVQIWERVAEDYAPFDVDVTTEEPAVFTTTTGRALITSSTDANGVQMPSGTAGGVAFVNVFGKADYVTASSPALIYYNNLGSVTSYIADVVAHELGHNLGLSHDGQTNGTEYYQGHGSGETSWGPIMGAPYGCNVTQWSKGEYYLANNTQDDIAILGTALGLRPDDAGNTITAATAAKITDTALSAAGVLGSSTDADIFSFTTGAGTISLTALPYRSDSGSFGGNADLKLELLNAGGNVVAAINPADTTGASLSYVAAAGAYYIRVSPSSTGTPTANPPTGYTVYGSMGQYAITGTIVPPAPTPVVNTAPTISTIASQTIASGGSTGALAFTVGDAETAATSLLVTAASSNLTLVPTANIALGGTDAGRTVNVTAASGQSGTATITLTVSDGALTASSSFTVTVTATNTPPTISSIASQTIYQGTSTSLLAFTIGDAQTSASKLTLKAGSSNTVLVPVANIVFGGTGTNRTVKVTPAPSQTGSAVITLTVSDGSLTASTSFTLTVLAPNTAPTISAIRNQTILMSTSTGPLAFTVGDSQTDAGSLVVSVTSSSTTLVPASGLVLGGTGSARTLTVTPAVKKTGSATITLSVSDGSLKTSTAFVLYVVASNDNFADALTLNGTSTQAAGSNSTATKQSGEPNHAGNAGGRSVWWRWIAPASGSVSLNTIGSSFNTLLAVYTGSSLTGLTAVASDNDSGGNLTSALTFSAVAGTSYSIAVDGYNGAAGTIRLSLSAAAAGLAVTLDGGPSVIVSDPADQFAMAGADVTFSVATTDDSSATYQWYHGDVAIPGAKRATLTLRNVGPDDAGSYWVAVVNAKGASASEPAELLIVSSEDDPGEN